ncbi:mycofactocin-coupled SDR family oxidoreductase [Amycolatopsis alkalitolerans]|uniref:NAD(P)-dependent oxidoreductase n=1 Tax=Amycolatopsis alkalitolerans TaxID=2547244 RepID=A0A5C4M769_9PSEU|nr:mycofactocin-coupled SDR family oxidoreductase [Amycolatopsis alkalitolerans]TNC29217.1 NAD(P)-dependent oxidoreductase [Amycolatopsis alkalitolerans]
MGSLDGKVAFITGAARGQGRSHAVRLAAEGADILAVDICAQLDSVPYPMATPEDLETTALEVEALGRRVWTAIADVRDFDALGKAMAEGLDRLGSVDIVLVNAGIAPMSVNDHQDAWQDVIDVNLTGVQNTLRLVAPVLVAQGRGGAIVITSSTMGLAGVGTDKPGALAYTASKHGVVGLMRAYANFLAPHSIRVNTVHPAGVGTTMVLNPAMEEYLQSVGTRSGGGNALPVDMVEPIDVSSAVAWLVSDAARYVTGVTLPVDAGYLNRR